MLKLKKEREDLFEVNLKMQIDHEQNVDDKRQRILKNKEQRNTKMQGLMDDMLSNRRYIVKHVRQNSQINDKKFQDYREFIRHQKSEKAMKVKQEEMKRHK
jgi:uncharacterized membrane-anchored protein YhcB (DUF1043 family)